MIDLVLCFFTAYYENEDKLVIQRKQISINYLKGSFIIDLLCVIPFNLIFKGAAYNKLLKILRIQRLTKLTRLIKFNRVMTNLKSQRKKNNLISNPTLYTARHAL